MKYGVLILAAGASTRMGTSKQLLKIDNQSLLQKTITTALEIKPTNCTVVLGSNFDLHKREIEHLPIDIILNPGWETGMGSSIKKGIQNLIQYELDAFHILVCDQPYLTSAHLGNLVAQFEKSHTNIIASKYQSVHGVPALFKSAMIATLLDLADHEGAKKIILNNPHETVEFTRGEVDLDTPEDFEKFIGG